MAKSTVAHGSTCHQIGAARPRQTVVTVYVGTYVTKGVRVDLTGQIGVLHSGQHVAKMVGLDVCGCTCPKGAKGRPIWRDRSVFMWVHMTKR